MVNSGIGSNIPCFSLDSPSAYVLPVAKRANDDISGFFLLFPILFFGVEKGKGGRGGKGEGNGEGNISTVLPFSPIIGSNKFLIEQFRGNLFNRYPLVSVLILSIHEEIPKSTGTVIF
jgi:hypothetical protein